MKMTIDKLTNWVRKLAETKPYKISVKNGSGFYEIVFLYGEWHYSDRLSPKDLENELECQKLVLGMCQVFERNIHLRVF